MSTRRARRADTGSPTQRTQRDRASVAIGCLHAGTFVMLASIVYILVTKAQFDEESLASARDPGFLAEVISKVNVWFVLAVAVIALVPVGFEIAVLFLRRRRFGGWVAAMCSFGFMASSLWLIPIAAAGIWALVQPGTRTACGVGTRAMPSEPSA